MSAATCCLTATRSLRGCTMCKGLPRQGLPEIDDHGHTAAEDLAAFLKSVVMPFRGPTLAIGDSACHIRIEFANGTYSKVAFDRKGQFVQTVFARWARRSSSIVVVLRVR